MALRRELFVGHFAAIHFTLGLETMPIPRFRLDAPLIALDFARQLSVAASRGEVASFITGRRGSLRRVSDSDGSVYATRYAVDQLRVKH